MTICRVEHTTRVPWWRTKPILRRVLLTVNVQIHSGGRRGGPTQICACLPRGPTASANFQHQQHTTTNTVKANTCQTFDLTEFVGPYRSRSKGGSPLAGRPSGTFHSWERTPPTIVHWTSKPHSGSAGWILHVQPHGDCFKKRKCDRFYHSLEMGGGRTFGRSPAVEPATEVAMDGALRANALGLCSGLNHRKSLNSLLKEVEN